MTPLLFIFALSMQPDSVVGSAQGALVDQDAHPVSGSRAQLFSSLSSSSEYRTISTDDGLIEFTNVPAGTYTLKILGKDFRPKSIRVRIEGGGHTLLGKIELQKDETSGVDDFSSLRGSFDLPCLTNLRILQESDGSTPVTIEFDELERRALVRKEPTWPKGGIRPHWITVYVAIDLSGKVACASVAVPESSFTRAAILAAQRWVFQPILSSGRPIVAIGMLQFSLDSE
jgi:hypothetical protein